MQHWRPGQALRIIVGAMCLSMLLWASGRSPAQAGINKWTRIGLKGKDVRVIAIDPGNPAILYAGTDDDGVFKTINGGANWSAINTGLSDLNIWAFAIDPITPTTLYVGTDGGGYKSIDGGGSWSAMTTGMSYPWVKAFAINPVIPTTLYAATDDGLVYKSIDGGGSWSATNSGWWGYGSVTTLTIDPSTSSILYLGEAGMGLFKSIDGGTSWSVTGLGGYNVNVLVIDPGTSTTLYAGSWGDDGGVLKSTDGGATWSTMNTGLSDEDDIKALAIDPGTSTTLYAGSWGDDGGVLVFHGEAVPQELYPDLTGTWLSLTQRCKGTGATLQCKLKGKAQVRNQGTQKAPTASLLRFYLSTDTVFDEGDTLLRQVSVGTLKSGKAKSKKLSYTLPISQTASGQYVLAVLDATGLIAEQDETNNIAVFGPMP